MLCINICELSKLASDDLWLNPPTPESLILRREVVDGLNESNLEELIQFSQNCMRTNNVEGLLGVIGLEIEVNTIEVLNGKKVHTVQNRDQFLIGLLGSLEAGNNENYTMKIDNIEINDNKSAVISITVSNPGNRDFESFYGQSIYERIKVELYQGRPVVTKLDINENA
jgi:hypothetical protein